VTKEIRILGAAAVRELLDLPSCIMAMRQAFLLVSTQKAVQPIRTTMPIPRGSGLLGLMPGWIASPARAGIKVLSIYPDNFGTQLGTHQGALLLFDPSDGQPVALLDAHALTGIRTAAASAVATDVLARAESSTLALLGYGDQAGAHLAALALVRPLRAVRVWGRNRDRAVAFAAAAAAATGLQVTPAASVTEAVQGADLICTLTAAATPILPGSLLAHGCHINAVGACVPTTAELDVEAVARARLFTDYRQSALALSGELRNAIAAGRVTEAHLLGEVGEVLTSMLKGRTHPEDITLFKSLGMAAEDLVAADLVYRRATERGVGTLAPF
jgi:ornithine cyclodeaminase